MTGRSKALLGCVLALLATGCGKRPPREVPFPVFDPRSPFPELAAGEEPAAPEKKASAFDRALLGTAPAADPTSREESRQSMPLGNGLLGDLPGDSGAWSWSADPRLTLAVHRGAAGVDALIWAEVFTPRMAEGPSAEIRRFQREIIPEEIDLDLDSYTSLFDHGRRRRLVRDTGLGALQAMRLLELARTRTAGLGLGFRLSGEGSSGVRWAGHNPRGVTVRLARSAGTWGRQRTFPAELAHGLGGLEKAAPELKPVADWMAQTASGEEPGAPAGGPAYLLAGSVAVENEAVGAHLAILCARVPDCPVAKDLSAFLGSLQVADLARLQRLQGSSAGDTADLARSAGLRILPSALVKAD